MASTKSLQAPSTAGMSPATLLFATSKAKEFTDYSKPYKNEALIRLRNSTVCLVLLVLLTYLLPVPSLWTAIGIVRGRSSFDAFWVVCVIEVLLSGLLVLNLLQAAIAIRYPRKPLPPVTSTPTKSLLTTPGPKKRRTTLPPNTSPQTQRSFSSSYAPSPISTPSRTLHYSIPAAPSPFGVSLGTSTSSTPSTPSPSLAAYHGKHPPSLGRAFNGSTLSMLTGDSDDDS